MPRVIFLLFLAALNLLLSAGEATAKDKETPPWMEDVITGDRKIYLIPKGAKKEVFGSQVTVETTEEYAARRIYEFEQFMEGRFKTMDENYAALKAEIDSLKNTVEQLQREISQAVKEVSGEAGVADDGEAAEQ
ncbi:MAG: hypothetical protein A3C36_00255 [Omnitrophica WOR_2 bacterium RIFCSPHIGHO2_02_FULL_52_10]|nr:MAG: hypothetical protein A3C36_00255 [Omnitrophica WOR_2 bacterium RIFCSPHIGHO2_02_FULL_52_10]